METSNQKSKPHRPKKRWIIFLTLAILLLSMLYASGLTGVLGLLAQELKMDNRTIERLISSILTTQWGIAFAGPTIVLLYLFKKVTDGYFHQRKLLNVQKLIDTNQVSLDLATSDASSEKEVPLNKIV